MRKRVAALLFFWLLVALPLEAKPRVYQPSIFYVNQADFPRGEVAFVNGMNHKPGRAVKCVSTIADLAGKRKIFGVYNPTCGIFGDLKNCYHELFKFKLTEPSRMLHEKWNAFFERHTHNEKYLQFCHSQGSIQVRNALLHYPHALRKRIIVIVIAPAAYISDAICHHAYHYASRRDIVPFLDKTGRKRCKDSTVTLTPHRKAAFFDHHFLSPTYSEAIHHHLQEYLKENGELWL